MRFQKRDGVILQAIHDNDGAMAMRHLKLKYWPDKSWRAIERRIKKLQDAGYIARPSREQYKIHPIPEPVCCLGWRGALFIAGTCGVEVESPTGDNEYQLRKFQRLLRARGIRWLREPRWSLLRHDLAVVDFRLAIENAVRELQSFTLEKWITESVFRSNTDVVIFTKKDKNGNVKQMEKGVCPDAYFEIVDEKRRMRGEPHKARFLLELDMATHDNPSFGREKAAPGAEYVKSPAYKARFGYNSGRWLVVTSGGEIRMRNLMRQVNKSVGDYARMFYFTHLDQLENGNVLTSPIWMQVGCSEPKPLFDL